MHTTALSDLLKEQTKTHHQLLEKQIIPFIKNIRSKEDYATLLMLFYTYFGGVELLVDKTINTDTMPDYLQRRKTAALKNDLQALHADPLPLANGTHLPMVENNLQAIGAMYVMEGSTLGGVHISKMIRELLPAADGNAFSFFNGYNSDTQPMWQAFKNNIDAVVSNDSEAATIIQSANDTFTGFSNWIRLQ